MVSCCPADIESNVHKKARWESGLMYLGWEFARILELSLLLRPDMSLNDQVRKLLEEDDWDPEEPLFEGDGSDLSAESWLERLEQEEIIDIFTVAAKDAKIKA